VDLRIAAFVELVLQHRTPEQVCYAIVCLAAPDDEEAEAAPTSAPGMFDELIDAEVTALRTVDKTTMTDTGET